MTEYDRNGVWRPRQLSPGKAVLAMLANTVPARRDPQAVIEILTKVAEAVPTLKGKRPDASAVVDDILALTTHT